jgi:hypothetical protein
MTRRFAANAPGVASAHEPIWTKGPDLPAPEPLSGDVAADACILGGGSVGEIAKSCQERNPHERPPAVARAQPIRFLGGQLVRSAIRRKERAEDSGRRAGRVTAAVACIHPTGFVDTAEASN